MDLPRPTMCPVCFSREATTVCRLCNVSKLPPTDADIDRYVYALLNDDSAAARMEAFFPQLLARRPELKAEAIRRYNDAQQYALDRARDERWGEIQEEDIRRVLG